MSESICRRCGRCCAVKIVVEGRVIYTRDMCRHLDPHTGLCTVYEWRHQVNPECADMSEAIRAGLLPADCPYVADIPDYVGPIETLPADSEAVLAERGDCNR